ncbi:SDR family oxidoreductase [Parerythrobacter aestuarii]|uniref:SDR family oxidoreductase n=1 Tax=Parerythrobacter aestuarii TaxID=3020909 RepID=UPI0024DE0EBB|nr:SDR family NAD(P)-dependent oxidoreductase [Parerythrobacter aestuarii]
MTDHIAGKSIVVTGAGGGFGRLVCEKAGARGAKLTCADIDLAAAEATAGAVREAGGEAQAVACDVREVGDVRAAVAASVDAYGGVDVMLNNAGIMPLAFWADHEAALDAWNRCIDINLKGIMHGIVAVHDQMIAQDRGQVINIASIYGNFPVAGAGIYSATKAAVGFLSESLRVESRGKIKVTTIRPTGVPTTGLSATVVNQAAGVGILGQNMPDFMEMLGQLAEGTFPAERLDPDNIDYASLAPEHIADAVIHVIDQPWGVSISDVTVRGAGDHFIL